MMRLVVGLVVFLAGFSLLKKHGFDEKTMMIMLLGISASGIADGVTQIIMGLLAMSSGAMVTGLFIALLNGFLFNMLLKRSNL